MIIALAWVCRQQKTDYLYSSNSRLFKEHTVNILYFNCFQGKNIIVFYGSQTGTAEEFANRLSKDAQRYGMKGMAADPEEYEMVIHNLWSSATKSLRQF